MWVQSLCWEDPLEEEMASHSSILAWKIPWTEEPSRLKFMDCKESEMTEWLSTIYFKIAWRKNKKNKLKIRNYKEDPNIMIELHAVKFWWHLNNHLTKYLAGSLLYIPCISFQMDHKNWKKKALGVLENMWK